MATITITNLSAQEIYLRDLGTVIGKAGNKDASKGRIDTITVTRPAAEVAKWSAVTVELAAGRISMTVIPNPDEAKNKIASNIPATSPITLYVDPSGSDSNPGTKAKPFRQPKAAIDSLPKDLYHSITILLAPGHYDGFNIEGFRTHTDDAAYLLVQGTMIDVTPTTGPATGTATGGTAGSTTDSTFGTLQMTGAGWTTDDFAQKFVEITGGAGVGQIFPISSNTSDTITICGNWTAPNATSTFAIREPGSIIDGVAFETKAMPPASASTTSIGVYIKDCGRGSNYNGACILIQKVKIAGPYYNGILSLDAQYDTRYCTIAPTNNSASALLSMSNCFVRARYSVLAPTHSSAWGISSGSSYAILPSTIDLQYSYVKAAKGADFWSAAATYVTGNYFKYTSFGVEYLSAPFMNSVQRCVFDGTGTAVSITYINNLGGFLPTSLYVRGSKFLNATTALSVENGNANVWLDNVSGTGNTTAIMSKLGARIRVNSNVTLTGTTELSIDGASHTLAEMRAATPKLLKDANYGTIVYE